MIDRPRLERLLGIPERARLLDRLVLRIERAEQLRGTLRLSGLSDAERRSLTGLLGRSRLVGTSVGVDLDELERRLVESGAAPSLHSAVQALRGPIALRADVAHRAAEARAVVEQPLRELCLERPEFADGVAGFLARGGLRRLTGNLDRMRVLADQAAQVLAALPAKDEGLAVFASRALGSAHALDAGTPVAGIVLAILGRGEVPSVGASLRRERWAAHGVLLDELSSTVLLHRLPVEGPLGDMTREGEPVVATLRQVRRLEVASVPEVFVCENPTVVEAAARELGTLCAPLVCVEGQPSAAATLLLQKLSPAVIRYHGDFDWGGIRVANTVFERVGFVPWRFTSADLRDGAGFAGEPLTGAPVDALWDSELRAALKLRGSRLEEEQLLDTLLGDLAS